MKKILIASMLLITLSACGDTKTVYVVDSLPDEVTTTTDKPTPTTKPRTFTTTTVSNYNPSSYFSFEEQDYLTGVQLAYNDTIYVSDEDLVSMAYTICDTLDSGVDLRTLGNVVLASISDYANDDIIKFVTAIIASAIVNMCPQHQWQIDSL